MAGELGQSGTGMATNVARHVQRVQTIHADQQNVANFTAMRRGIEIGSCNQECKQRNRHKSAHALLLELARIARFEGRIWIKRQGYSEMKMRLKTDEHKPQSRCLAAMSRQTPGIAIWMRLPFCLTEG